MPNIGGNKFSHTGISPKVGQKQKTEKREEGKKDRKLVITMASYALQRHLGWHTQSRMGQNIVLVTLSGLATSVQFSESLVRQQSQNEFPFC